MLARFSRQDGVKGAGPDADSRLAHRLQRPRITPRRDVWRVVRRVAHRASSSTPCIGLGHLGGPEVGVHLPRRTRQHVTCLEERFEIGADGRPSG